MGVHGRGDGSRAQQVIAIAGCGRIGQALGWLLAESGRPVAYAADRNLERAKAGAGFVGRGCQACGLPDLARWASRILITVADDAVPEVAALIATAGMKSGAALHTSGALGPDVLEPLKKNGVSCGVLHPMQTVPTREGGITALRGVPFGITASGPAFDWALDIVQCLSGRPLPIPEESRPLYHAAAVVASNHFVALVSSAVDLLEQAGLNRSEALECLEPLVESTRRNVFELGPRRALTGPVARGDAATIACHLRALSSLSRSNQDLYRSAALHALEIARRRGLDSAKATLIEELLTPRDPGGITPAPQ